MHEFEYTRDIYEVSNTLHCEYRTAKTDWTALVIVMNLGWKVHFAAYMIDAKDIIRGCPITGSMCMTAVFIGIYALLKMQTVDKKAWYHVMNMSKAQLLAYSRLLVKLYDNRLSQDDLKMALKLSIDVWPEIRAIIQTDGEL